MGAVRTADIRPGRAAWDRLDHDGAERRYRVVAPPGVVGGPSPLVLALHGGGGVPRGMALMTRFDAAAVREGFVVAYPAGLERTWNAGACCGPAARDGVDDVGFVAALIERLVERLGVDARRTFVTGFSNGGMLAYRLAAERPDLVGAIAPVASGMLPPAAPSAPVSVLAIHGTRDLNAPYGGGVGPRSLSGVSYPPVRDVVGRWVAACGCAPSARVERVADVVRETWSGGQGGTEVCLVTVEDGGHTWPGGRALAGILDPPGTSLDATAEIWRFFAEHPRRGG